MSDIQQLVTVALSAIEELQRHSSELNGRVSFARPTDLLGLPDGEAQALLHSEVQEQLDTPVSSALHFCIASAHSLVGVAEVLLKQEEMTPYERARTWKALSELTKLAGRSAYRATLLLVEDSAAMRSGGDEALPATTAIPDSRPMPLH